MISAHFIVVSSLFPAIAKNSNKICANDLSCLPASLELFIHKVHSEVIMLRCDRHRTLF